MRLSTMMIIILLGVIAYMAYDRPERKAAVEKEAAEQRQRDLDRQERLDMQAAARQAQLLSTMPPPPTPAKPTAWMSSGSALDRPAYNHAGSAPAAR